MIKSKVNRAGLNLFIAFLINALFLILVIVFCDMKYEVSDDFIVDSILSGAYGNGYDEHLLFSNILIGYLLKGIYKITSNVSWYFVGHILVCFVSLTTISYIIMRNNQRTIALVLVVIFVSFFSDDVYILVQFTKTATVAIFAGGSLIIDALWNKTRYKKCKICFGTILALVGSMIRFSCIYIAGGFLLILYIRYAIKNRKSSVFLKKTISSFAFCVAMVGIAFILDYSNTVLWHIDKEYGNYSDFTRLRSSVVDVDNYGYNTISAMPGCEMVTNADYNMVMAWDIVDRDNFTAQKLHSIATAKKLYSDSVTHDLKNVFRQFKNRRYYKYTVIWGLCVLFIVSVLLNKRNIYNGLLVCFATVAMLLYFFYAGRVVYRVEYGVIFCAAATIAVCNNEYSHKNISVKISAVIIAFIMLCKIPLYIPDAEYKTMNDEEYAQYIKECFYESWNFGIKKYRCSVSRRRPHENLMQLLENNEDNYYLIDFNTGIQLIYYNYKPWQRIRAGYFNEYSYIGGVQMRYPDELQVWNNKGIDVVNPNESLIKDNIYVVDVYNINTRLEYLREKYYEDIGVQLIENVDGFDIIKYYLNQ